MCEILWFCVENDFFRIFLFKIDALSHFRFLPLNDRSIRIWQAFSKIYVIMFKNIFELLILCVHCKVLTPKGNVTIIFLTTKTYVEIDTLVLFALSSLFPHKLFEMLLHIARWVTRLKDVTVRKYIYICFLLVLIKGNIILRLGKTG